MEPRHILIPFLLSLLLCCADAAGADYEKDHPFSATISIRLSVSNKELERRMQSYLIREVGYLGDVRLVQEKADWVLNILAYELVATDGQPMAVIVSTVVLKPFDNTMLVYAAQPDIRNAVKESTSRLSEFSNHRQWAAFGRGYDLDRDVQTVCRDIVLSFDSKQLNDERRTYRGVMQELRRLK